MKIITIIGARPQFVKAATVSRAILEHNKANPLNSIEELIVHTGQHYDANMSDVFFTEMEIPKPAYTLGVGGGGHGAMTGRQLEKIEEVLLKEKPDYVLVYGDTNSTLAGALAAAKLHIPVVHVEAGLRSFNMKMPEEINRILTDQISDVLFCPTETAINNLKNEGFESKTCQIFNVGDVMYDAAMYYSPKSKKPNSVNVDNNFALVTIHRADNTDNVERLTNIVKALNEIHLQTPVVCPIHPRTRKMMAELSIVPNFEMIEPVGYFEMIWLLKNCALVITDSGGLQKEAYFFKKPCITMRDQTEWVELIEAGVNQLVGASQSLIVEKSVEVKKLIRDNSSFNKEIYGTGNAANNIIELLVDLK
ncbi:non-hydrolyzing UDP-N-acetylglucosamine 2-epimerase [Colwellia sp. MB02u-9]|uniref:non-hydrolyzing UDP-N-acetylglucosamine 2-epimerase n=1 Tax=Colwellia sp. MB02u-9 TaxID=2759823 RepID=UPI0015F4FC91|nr:UDP-N-acetylglucosamine 2-epimerase (non-hydrolyzing) [Colwellia sp. MB02u-9]MBA6296946.1 UDP-N-acetylglucosamine 2-epimerase (non-hydrolyzing) [Colwellia sp. MB02u-9]